MSKKIKLFSVALVVFVVVLVALAGSALAATYTPALHSNVVGSAHDLTAGTDIGNVCEECHVPHGAGSTQFLWAAPPGSFPVATGQSSDIIALCYSCHDGTTPVENLPSTTLGQYTVFDQTKTMHSMTSKTNNGGKTGKDCDRCHDPHENSTVRPNFIRYYKVGSTTTVLALGPDICATCHTGQVQGGIGHGQTTPQNNHPIDALGAVSAATAAGAPINTGMVVYNPNTLPAPTWGTRLFVPGNPALPAVQDPAATVYDATTHRLVLGLASAATSQVKCESCHAPHGGYNDKLNTMNISDGALCSNCHK